MSNAITAVRGAARSPPAEETAWRVTAALCCVALVLPLMLVDVPPVLDYPNHLARLWILAVGATDPIVAAMAQARWAVVPNLGIDLLVPSLIRALSVHVAGRLMLAGLLLVLFAGCLSYSRALLGYRSPWALASALVACNAAFLMGFLNFCLGVGLALLFAAHWLRNRDVRPAATLMVAVPAATVLFLCHMMGLFFYLLLIGCSEIAQAWRRPGNRTEALARRAAFAVPLLVLPVWLYALSPLGALDGPPSWSSWTDKAMRGLYPLFGYEPWLDLGTGVAIVVLVGALAVTGRLRVPLATLLAGGVLAVLYVVTPFTVKGASFFDIRFIVMLWILLFAGLTPVRLTPRLGGAIAMSLALLFAARMGMVASVWNDYRAELAQLRWVLAPIHPGERVLVAGAFPEEAPAYFANGPRSKRMPDGTMTNAHRTALVLIERRAFWPPLFANPTQQPVRYLPPLDGMAEPSGRIPSPLMLAGSGLNEEERGWFPIWDRWWRNFDWVLLQDPGGIQDLATFGGGHLEVVRANAAAALFRVRPGSAVPVAAAASP